MSDLETICRTMLDNANMGVEFEQCPFAIRLTFAVVGTDKKVIFDCSEVAAFHLEKEPDDLPEYVVMEVRVTGPRKQRPSGLSDFEFSRLDQDDYLWQIEVLPGAQLRVKARAFAWEVVTMSAEELRWRNGEATVAGPDQGAA